MFLDPTFIKYACCGSGSGSGSIGYGSKKIKNFLSLKTDFNIPSKSTNHKNYETKKYFLPGSGSISQWYGSTDPDPLQNVRAPQHCRKTMIFT
jgi:hypothetical protein